MTDQELHDALLAATAGLRDKLSDANIGSHFNLTIEIKGRLNSSEPAMVAYRLNESLWQGGPEGNRLGPVADELIRRHGWSKRHSPLQLTSEVEPAPAGMPAIHPA
jgi:hypothetical protein